MLVETLKPSIDVRQRPRRRVRSPWRALTALTAAFALIFLLMLAASHHHQDSAETDSCAVCGVGLHQLSGVPGAPMAAPLLILLPYRLAAVVIYHCPYIRTRVLPPSCGPPAIA
jgi:hypothetical protein